MRRSTLWTCALLAIATSGCEQFNTQLANLKQKIAGLRGQSASPAPAKAAPAKPLPAPAAGPAHAEPAAPATSPAPEPARHARRSTPGTEVPAPPEAFRDMSYASPDTGTIAPGMGE